MSISVMPDDWNLDPRVQRRLKSLEARVTWLERKISDLEIDKMEEGTLEEKKPLLDIRVDRSYVTNHREFFGPGGTFERRGIADSP